MGVKERIEKANDSRKEHFEWVFQGGIPVWERYNKQRRVAMAACRVNGYILVGVRHFCPIMRMQMEAIGLTGDVFEREHDMRTDQGFVDQWGVWMSREEAYVVAKEAGQIINEDVTPGTLYSECYI